MNVLHWNSKTSATTILNSTAETVLYSMTVPQNMMVVTGRAVRYELHGSILGQDTTNPEITIRARIRPSTSTGNGTLVMETTSFTVATSTLTRAWNMSGGMMATSTQDQVHWAELAVGAVGAGIRPTTKSFQGRGSSTQNETTLVLNITGQLSLPSTQLTLTAQVGSMELVR